MHLIWKRPDGFQNAQPEDFRRIPLSNGTHLWLHKHEIEWYPFQVSGDWEGQDQTRRINRLVNKLGSNQAAWRTFLEQEINKNDSARTESVGEIQSIAGIAKSLVDWLQSLEKSTKGHTWEVDIILCALRDVQAQLMPFL